MSYADDYILTRSSVFKTLVFLFVCITFINLIVIRQVYMDSNAFHHKQLTAQLNDEIREFTFAASQSREEVERLLLMKRASASPFRYHISDNNADSASNLFYPVRTLPTEVASISIQSNLHLEVGIDPQPLDEFRRSLVPIVFSGMIFPVVLMSFAAFFFTIIIQRRLEQVNKAMNRVMCGERDVKLPVSRQDDEFDILAIHLNFMIEQMHSNESTLKSLTVGLAHDMRTPIARLKLRLEDVLKNNHFKPEQRNAIVACHDELDLLHSLFSSMLEIAKLNAKQTEIAFDVVNLGVIAKDAIEFITPIAEQKQQEILFREDQVCLVKGDRSLLFRAIFNLVENAVKYTPEKGSIQIIVDKLGVVVSDTGIGISHLDKHHVCEPMYRADKSRTEQGNGLGLSLVDAVVRRHNAQLLFQDNHPGLRARILFD